MPKQKMVVTPFYPHHCCCCCFNVMMVFVVISYERTSGLVASVLFFACCVYGRHHHTKLERMNWVLVSYTRKHSLIVMVQSWVWNFVSTLPAALPATPINTYLYFVFLPSHTSWLFWALLEFLVFFHLKRSGWFIFILF